MSESKHLLPNEQFIERWKDYAMRLQIKYGVPASVTLAQGLLESSRGRSFQAQNNNNFFGLRLGGGYIKFKHPEDSFYYYVRTVTGGSAFRNRTAGMTSRDGAGAWIRQICRGGYAEDGKYRPKIEKIISSMNLEKYDRQARAMAKSESVQEGRFRGSRKGDDPAPYEGSRRSGAIGSYDFDENSIQAQTDFSLEQLSNMDYDQLMTVLMNSAAAQGATRDSGRKYEIPLKADGRNYCMPTKENVLVVTGGYGNDRGDHKHQGLDVRAAMGTPVYATEDGTIVRRKDDPTGRGGNYVSVRYDRPDGSKYVVTYMHLSELPGKKEGDTVKAGEPIGRSGNSGQRPGGGSYRPHLHVQVWKGSASDQWNPGEFHSDKNIDPSRYFAELSTLTNSPEWCCVEQGTDKDLTAQYKAKMGLVGGGNSQNEENLQNAIAMSGLMGVNSLDDYIRKMVAQSDDGLPQGGSLLEMVFNLAVKSLGTLATLAMSDEMLSGLSGDEPERAKVTPGLKNELDNTKAEEAQKEMKATESAVYAENTERQQQDVSREMKNA